MKLHQIPKEIKNEINFPFWFSLLKESLNIFNFTPNAKILDFGCGSGGFLRLFEFYLPGRNLTGVEIDSNLILECQATFGEHISFLPYQKISSISDGYFDAVFSQEVIYTLPNMEIHAKQMFSIIREGGYYFATMGCHIQNPTWACRRDKIRTTEKYYAYDYSLDEVAKAFFNAGFRVSVKRLPVCAPLKFSVEGDSDFDSVHDLLLSSHEYKIMFSFMKPKIKP